MEFQDFSSSLFLISLASTKNIRNWSLGASGFYAVKSFTKYLDSSTLMDNPLFSVIWKSRSSKKVNILM